MNKAILIGRLGKDAELKTTSRDPVCKFSLATEEKWKNARGEKQARTTWHNCILWGKRGEALVQYLRKGTRLMVEGQIDNRSYDGPDGKRYVTEIKVTEIELLGDGKAGGGQRREAGDEDPEYGGAPSYGGAPDHGENAGYGGAPGASAPVDDDVPF